MATRKNRRKESREIEVTEDLLKDYRSMKDELAETKYKLYHLDDNDAMIGNDVIFDYSTGQPRPQSVVGYDCAKADRMKSMYGNRIKKLEERMSAVEKYIDGLPSSISRRVMGMFYLQGMTQKSISCTIHKSQAKVSRILSAELSKVRKDSSE